MRKFIAFGFAIALAALMAAPLAVGSDMVNVSGTVTNSATGGPVSGATVTLSYWSDVIYSGAGGGDEIFCEYSAVTGADGTFSLAVAAGSYGVYVAAQGYEMWYGSLDTVYGKELDIGLREVPPYDATLTLSVTDAETGAGVPGAQVYGWPDMTYGTEIGVLGFPSYQEIAGETDAQGKFVTGIWNGAYTISVSADDYFYTSESLVVSGEDVSTVVEMTPVPSPNSTLSGTVVDQATGAPVAGAEIWISPDYSYIGNCWGGYSSPEAVYTDAAGNYTAQVYGGANYVSIYSDGYYSYWGSVNVPDNFAMSFDAALFPIVEPDSVSVLKGKVTSESGESVSGATVQVTYWPNTYCYDYMRTEENGPSYGYGAPPSDPGMGGIGMATGEMDVAGAYYGGYYGQPWYYEAVTGANGEYNLAVPVGDLSVSVWAEGFCPYYGWTSIGYEGTFWLNATLSPVPEPDAAVSGAVTDAVTGEPIQGAHVSAYLIRDPVEMYDTAVEVAVDEGVYSDVAGPGMAVEPMIAPDKLGYVDPYGYYYSEAVTDEDGGFLLEVPHGQQAISIWADGYAYYESLLDVEEGETVIVEVALARSSDEAMAGYGDGSNRQYVLSVDADMTTLPSAGGVEKLTLAPGESREISMSDVFEGAEGLTYSYEAPENLRVSYDESAGTLRVTAPDGWTGDEDITLKASDGTGTVYKSLTVSVSPQSSFMVLAGFAAAIAVAAIIVAAIWKTQKD
jgi:hypothetical protein